MARPRRTPARPRGGGRGGSRTNRPAGGPETVLESFLEVGTVNQPKLTNILTVSGAYSSPPQKVTTATAGVESPGEIKAIVAEKAIPGAVEDAGIVRSIIFSEGAGRLLRDNPKMPLAILHEVYARAGKEAIEERRPLDPKTIETEARAIVAELEPQAYRKRVEDTLIATGVQPKRVKQVVATMKRKRVALDSPRFEREVFAAMKETALEDQFDDFFTQPSRPGTKAIEDELGDALTPELRIRAIRELKRLGIDPKRVVSADDREDWARVAIALADVDGAGDIGLAAFTSDPTSIDIGGDLDLPEFETAEVTGLLPENIRTCADLYYIHMFDRLGVFRVVDALAVRFFDRMNLGLSDTARKLYVYIKRRSDRIPAEDRRRITDRIFEGDPDGRSAFKLLMGQMVETLIEFTRVRNAGELLLSGDRGFRGASAVGTRSAVLRSIENLQRYLSRAGGGMSPFLAREAGSQLIQCFEILDSAELKTYFGGEFTEGMWSIIEEINEEIDGRPGPPADRMRILAVNGRRIIRFLADHADGVDSISDSELEQLAKEVQAWLAAFRKPAIEEPDWLEDDDDLYGEEEEGPAAEAIAEARREAEADEADVLEVG